jgi:hypothetical protein
MAWLGACRSHGTVEMGEQVAKQAMQIGQAASDPDNAL